MQSHSHPQTDVLRTIAGRHACSRHPYVYTCFSVCGCGLYGQTAAEEGGGDARLQRQWLAFLLLLGLRRRLSATGEEEVEEEDEGSTLLQLAGELERWFVVNETGVASFDASEMTDHDAGITHNQASTSVSSCGRCCDPSRRQRRRRRRKGKGRAILPLQVLLLQMLQMLRLVLSLQQRSWPGRCSWGWRSRRSSTSASLAGALMHFIDCLVNDGTACVPLFI